MSAVTSVAATIYAASVPQPGRPNEDALFVGRQAGAPLAAVFDGQGNAEGAAKKAARQLERLYTESGGRVDWTRTTKLLDLRTVGVEKLRGSRPVQSASALRVQPFQLASGFLGSPLRIPLTVEHGCQWSARLPTDELGVFVRATGLRNASYVDVYSDLSCHTHSGSHRQAISSA